jgi:hypothetical protein
MKMKSRLGAGAALAISAGILVAVMSPKQHEKEVAFRHQLETEMHTVLMGKVAMQLNGYELDTYELFLDAGTPTEATDNLLNNMGYSPEEPASEQAYTLAACAVSAATRGIPDQAKGQYQSEDLVGARSTCLADVVTGITTGQIQEVKAPEALKAIE